MIGQYLTTVESHAFVVSNPLGDIDRGSEQGLFAADTRFLSRYTLRLAGETPILLRAGASAPHESVVYATNQALDGLPPYTLEVIRRRRIGDDFVETIALTNRGLDPVTTELVLRFDADFADIFEVRALTAARPPRRSIGRTEDNQIDFRDRERGRDRVTHIRFSREPSSVSRGIAHFPLTLAAGERWAVDVKVEWTIPYAATIHPVSAAEVAVAEPLTEWIAHVPQLTTDDPDLQLAYARAVRDLASLELTLSSGLAIPAAGVPWYMAIFGRDAIIASLQSLILGPRFALGTLRTLALYQATEDDPYRDAEPGKMPHEIRFGELADTGVVPHARYYGTADATPLWLILLAQTVRWTGDHDLFTDLLPHAERALRWIDDYGDLDGDGFVEYERRSPRGLENQGWKDSWDSIRFADGRLAEGPIALVEVQGYVYAAKCLIADQFDAIGRHNDARRLRDQATALKRRVQEAFWLPEQQFYALALADEKQPVDSITSNPGHLLWSGLVDEPYAGQVVERLMSPECFTGWGIRTMASTMAAYNPISYHDGSVWPHDNSLIVAGFRRYGYALEAAAIGNGLIAATRWFDLHRLPELFCGYERGETPFPVDYPVACSPQAWAAGSILLLLREIIGLSPDHGGLDANPLPFGRTVRLTDIPFRGSRETVAASG